MLVAVGVATTPVERIVWIDLEAATLAGTRPFFAEVYQPKRRFCRRRMTVVRRPRPLRPPLRRSPEQARSGFFLVRSPKSTTSGPVPGARSSILTDRHSLDPDGVSTNRSAVR